MARRSARSVRGRGGCGHIVADPNALPAINNSHIASSPADDLLITGGTGTNVADVQVFRNGGIANSEMWPAGTLTTDIARLFSFVPKGLVRYGDEVVVVVRNSDGAIDTAAATADDVAEFADELRTETIGGQICVYTCVVDGETIYVGITNATQPSAGKAPWLSKERPHK